MDKNGKNNQYVVNVKPSVSSPDYHLFRKANNDETHAAYFVRTVAGKMKKGNSSFNEFIKTVREMYDNDKVAKSAPRSTDYQVLQYFNQLSDKGVIAAYNKISVIVETR